MPNRDLSLLLGERPNRKSKIENRKFPIRRRGVGLVELLVALAISAALLTSVAVAVDASFKAYAVNQSQAQLTQRARLAMNRILSTIRSTSTHAPPTDSVFTQFQNGHIVSDSGIEMMTDATNGVSFQQLGDELDMIPFTITGGVQTYGISATLLRGVAENGFVVSFEPQRSAQSIKIGGKYDQLKRASIVLTLNPSAETTLEGERDSNASVSLSASIMPRKNLW